MTRIEKNSRPYHILKTALVGGGVLFISTISPLSGTLLIKKLIKQYLKDKKIRKERFLQDVKRLQNRKLIDYVQLPDGKIKITLTKLGKNKILTYNLDHMKLEERPWDGKWRLITFDIPDYQKNARNALRKKVRELGFYPLQKSVFITPYECENEIDFICSIFEINRNNVLILEVGNFEGSEKMRHYFHL
ncbi:hypothetical protein COU12_02130 [Candidatus Jorgensenbacteria bacterium CG10_big_fil_rev_8_21_14_0_10_54_38]|uniref:Transcriptional repressor PaaX-like central Cas2-like domain-containing protein n=2 Tax=Candidatus Joergenseniibacteriota TaxID=1752739 RepID=A0A2M6WFQ9_9BACT|nr:MAG: hypothetical protein COX26_01535 [Candidatus Jorgensenbacteria bacterium CG23_combo_of_CG06-09_8_20_14_all_54_14]PIT91616.1 MAG: hypothetical protein COU12_02130 [Candidatus Jorgensenbacteria bacterium CG10_big_fil_rev_8_21_14_0_10_54_38]